MCDVQVVCAGVWHNAVLCALCWLCALLLPLLLVPLYSTGSGTTVRYMLSGLWLVCSVSTWHSGVPQCGQSVQKASYGFSGQMAEHELEGACRIICKNWF